MLWGQKNSWMTRPMQHLKAVAKPASPRISCDDLDQAPIKGSCPPMTSKILHGNGVC